MKARVLETRIPLERPFTIARSTSTEAHVLHLALEHDGITGWGEACPSPGVTGEDVKQARAALDRLDPAALDIDDIAATLLAHGDLGPSARAAVDLALHDLAGKRDGRPVHELLGLPEGMEPSAATITITDPAGARQQAEAWLKRGYVRQKVKVGGPEDLEVVRAVTEVLPERVRDPFPDPQVWVDANESLDLAGARELLPELAALDVELLEQPLPRDDRDGLAALLDASPLPIVVDEAIQGPEDVAALSDLEGPLGINIKVQKVGGLLAARACLEEARSQGRRVLVGCNIETGLGIAAGSALVGAVDWVDLDGNLFLAHDPFPLPRPMPGHAGTLDGPGLGVAADPRYVPG